MLHFNINNHNHRYNSKIKYMLFRAQYGSRSYYGLVYCAFLYLNRGVVPNKSFGRRTERAPPE